MKQINLDDLLARPPREWYGEFAEIPVQLIKPDPENLRTEFDESDLVDLGRNIQQVGQMDAITVFPILDPDGEWEGYFDLHDGERRWRASQLVGLTSLISEIVPRPSRQELMFKKVSRVMQTRSLSPETKLAGLEKALTDLDIIDQPDQWESFRSKLGGGTDWPQLVRVLRLHPRVRMMFADKLINFTIAQSLGRLEQERQVPLAQFAVVNKINGRFLSTEMVPYMIKNPEASAAQAFEHARVGGWRQFTRSPYGKGAAPKADEHAEKFLGACVAWERAWESMVMAGLSSDIRSDAQYLYRLKEACRRLGERASGLLERLETIDDTPALRPNATVVISESRALPYNGQSEGMHALESAESNEVAG